MLACILRTSPIRPHRNREAGEGGNKMEIHQKISLPAGRNTGDKKEEK